MGDSKIVDVYCCNKWLLGAMPGAWVMCNECRQWQEVKPGEKKEAAQNGQKN